jgi:hypothetical protein
MLTALLFFAAVVFAFGAKNETRMVVCVLIFAAIVFSLLGN